MSNFPEQLPHGALTEVLPDVFMVSGMIRIQAAETHEFSRNMTVLRDGDTLTLVNTLSLDEQGLAALDALGSVRHIVKLGAYHGRDDAFYLNRYKAELWAPEGMTCSRGESTSQLLHDGAPGPVSGSSAFVFDTPNAPEAILHLDQHDGLLITCDSFQSTAGPDEYFNATSAASKKRLGFFGRPVIGPGWKKAANPQADDFDRLLALPFRHMMTGHGAPMLHDAPQAVRRLLEKERHKP